jgi:hypothetical protein
MKYIYFILSFLFCFIEAKLGGKKNISINGQWIQVLSNRFVQETFEKDWKCIQTNIYPNKNNNIIIEKNGIIKNFKDLNITLITEYNLKQNQNKYYILYPISMFTLPLQIKYIKENKYIIMTDLNNNSLFVFSNDYLDFYKTYKNETMDLIRSLNFTNYYKYPLPSYTQDCLYPF